MKPERKGASFRSLVAILCTIILLPGDTLAYTPQQSSAPARNQRARRPRFRPSNWILW